MADASVTLTQSQNSSSSGVTYRGYVLDSCNNNSHVADGSWSPSSATGIGVSTSGSKITVWNSNTSTSSASATFTWTSSLVSGCSKTLSVTANGKSKNYCPSVSIELYDNSNNVISGTTTESTINIKITINDWKDIPESNKKTFGSYSNGGNNITYSLPSGYTPGYSYWIDDNNFTILGGLSNSQLNGTYTFSVTSCSSTTSKTITKSSTQQPCPDFSVSVSNFSISPYESKTINLKISNWNSTITDYTFTKYFSIVENKKQNMTYSVGNYSNGYYPITITHDSSETNSVSDGINITINSKNSSCNKSASISGRLNVGYFNVKFNVTGTITSSNEWVYVYVNYNGQKQIVGQLDSSSSDYNQRYAAIWKSTLDTGPNAGKCPSRSFTVSIDYRGVKSATITSGASGTISNTCTSADFDITCKVIV